MIRILGASVIVISLACGSASAPSPTPSRATSASRGPLPSSHILFESNRDGDGEIYAVNADGTRLAQLTDNRSDDQYAVASHNGRRIAFGCGDALCLIGADGRGKRRLKDGNTDYMGWSPDGSKLAYTSYNYAPDGLSEVTPDGRRRRLTRGQDDRLIDWSPDSRSILFGRKVEEKDDLFIVRSPGGTVTKIASDVEFFATHWSPKRGAIAYTVDVYPGDDRVLIFDVRTGEARQVYTRMSVYALDWSPDGTMLAISGADEDSSSTSLEVIAIDDQTRVVAHATARYGSLWSPDSKRIALGVERGNGSGIAVLTVASGAIRLLRSGLPNRWSPDGRWIAYDTNAGISAVRVDDRQTRVLVPKRGSTAIIGWYPGRVAPRAPRPRRIPAVELATERALRARGGIANISASGSRVSAVVGPSRLDCDHVVVWTAQTPAIARASAPGPCFGGGSGLVDLRMRGRRVYWATRWECGNSECSRSLAFGILRGPRRLKVRGDGQGYNYGDGEKEPALPWGGAEPIPTRKHPVRVMGITMYVTGRRIQIGRETLRPPGAGPVMARLTRAGLFYAYSGKGAFPGRVFFVPFAALR